MILKMAEIYPEGVDKFEYLKEYVMEKFERLSPEDAFTPTYSTCMYLCQWTLDDFDGTILYMVVDANELEMRLTCEETIVGIYVWTDDEDADFSDYDVTKPLRDIASSLHDILGWFSFVAENHLTTGKNRAALQLNKAVCEAECDGTCAVCLDDYKRGDSVVLLTNCRHVFCGGCIDKWVEQNDTCPLCRTSM